MGWLKHAAVIDFETLDIRDRPSFPPEPVGVALDVPGRKPVYRAWGHLEGSSCAWGQARRELGELIASGRPLLFHNAKFDLAVACERLALPLPPWGQVHDTLPMLFLRDPRAATYSLKPSAELLLGEAPDERDAVLDWLTERQPVPGEKLTDNPKGKRYAGTYVALAPASVVGPYALGDVGRTRRLAALVYPELERRGMVEAYDRERRLLPHLMAMEREGVRVDVPRLTRDVRLYAAARLAVDQWLFRRLRTKPFNVDSGQELVAALLAAQVATEAGLGLTKTGKVATSKDALEAGVTDPQVQAALRWRALVGTCLRTFMEPWLGVASRTGGLIFTTWHSTRTSHHESGVGTRTGRLSSTPNFQNIVKDPAPLFRCAGHGDLPLAPLTLPPLPRVRSYVVPYETNDVLLDRDYSQQELRLLGHFEDGDLREAYCKNPRMDHHEHVRQLINTTLGTSYERKPVKNTNFGLIYGMGVGKLADKNGTTVEEARKLKNAILALLPGLKDLYADMKARAKAHEPIRTWGGREYFCEEPRFVDGRLQEYDYKLVNVLIQGSAADVTKEALIRYCDAKPKHHRVLMTVHDELVTSVPCDEREAAMAQLREAMESVKLDVPLLSDGSWSPKSWADLKEE